MKQKDVKLLAEKYRKGTCTPEELASLESWYNTIEGTGQVPESNVTTSMAEVWGRLGLKPAPGVKYWPRIVAAASIALVIAAGIYLFSLHKTGKSDSEGIVTQNDALPGKNKATLTLADGKTIALSEARAGLVITASGLKYEDGSNILSTREGFSNAKNLVARQLAVSTPRGGTYQVLLPDGTRVWLNAGSYLKFPSSFFGSANRRIELSGEGYFEVAKDKVHPFIVHSKNQDVKVLGTHFNISAYQDERELKTTLLEGAVQVSTSLKAKTVRLAPGQQAILNGETLNVKAINANEAVAWKNGNFLFNEESLSSIMKQLERWYNVKVDYSTVPDTRYYGAISRNVKLSKVLEMLEQTGNLKLRIEKNVIKVY